MNKKKLDKVLAELFKLMSSMALSDPLKVFLLDSLSIYMRVDGRVLKQN